MHSGQKRQTDGIRQAGFAEAAQVLFFRLLIAIVPARRTPPSTTFFTVSSALQ